MFSLLLIAVVSIHLSHARIGVVVPNTYETHQLTCPEQSVYPCPVEGAFTQTNTFDVANHRIYEGYINCTTAKVSITTSGLGTANSALTTQLLIDYYRFGKDPIDFIISYGIAGGMDDRLNIGDVVVPAKWSLYNSWSWQNAEHGDEDMLPLESTGDFTRSYGYWQSDKYHKVWFQPQELFNETAEERVHTMYFYADRDAIEIMRNISDQIEGKLHSCAIGLFDGSQQCLEYTPQIVTQVNGVEAAGISADIFVDNVEWRQTLFAQYSAQSLDMQTATIAMVAETNNIPFIAFRSLSDLAGEKEKNGSNVIEIFLEIAVENSITVLTEWIYAAYCANGGFADDGDSSKSEISKVFTQLSTANVNVLVSIVCGVFVVICVVLVVIWCCKRSKQGSYGHMVINDELDDLDDLNGGSE